MARTYIDDLELSVRAFNVLKRAGINTVEEMEELSLIKLRKLRNLGKKSFEEVLDKYLWWLGVKRSENTKKEIKDVYKNPRPTLKDEPEGINDRDGDNVELPGLEPGELPVDDEFIEEAEFNLESAIQDEEEGPSISPREQLSELIGLEKVKEQVRKIAAFAKLKKAMAAEKKSSVPMVLNMEFVGNPGTAKTTVARIIAGILYEVGILETAEPVEVGRADLVGGYVGETAIKVKRVFREAEGALLFVDEAYSLADCYKGSYGDEAINAMVAEMENNRDNTVVVLAGYPDRMEEFFAKNPGLRSRVPFTLKFEDYSLDEMTSILKLEANKRGFSLSEDAVDRARSICEVAVDNPELGNGRFCRNLVENSILSYSVRVFGEEVGEKENDYVLDPEDFVESDNMKPRKRAAVIGF